MLVKCIKATPYYRENLEKHQEPDAVSQQGRYYKVRHNTNIVVDLDDYKICEIYGNTFASNFRYASKNDIYKIAVQRVNEAIVEEAQLRKELTRNETIKFNIIESEGE